MVRGSLSACSGKISGCDSAAHRSTPARTRADRLGDHHNIEEPQVNIPPSERIRLARQMARQMRVYVRLERDEMGPFLIGCGAGLLVSAILMMVLL